MEASATSFTGRSPQVNQLVNVARVETIAIRTEIAMPSHGQQSFILVHVRFSFVPW
jgi:hypothetical protein